MLYTCWIIHLIVTNFFDFAFQIPSFAPISFQSSCTLCLPNRSIASLIRLPLQTALGKGLERPSKNKYKRASASESSGLGVITALIRVAKSWAWQARVATFQGYVLLTCLGPLLAPNNKGKEEL